MTNSPLCCWAPVSGLVTERMSTFVGLRSRVNSAMLTSRMSHRTGCALGVFLGLCLACRGEPPAALPTAESAHALEVAHAPSAAGATGTQAPAQRSVAVLAGGCFWGMEDLLRKLPGVIGTNVGYTGGTLHNPVYEDVHTGATNHAESVRIEFDPSVLSYERLLAYFFSIHDPTTKNRQGNDVGTQYRSAIFVLDADQRKVAEQVIARVAASGDWKGTITTEVLDATEFYPAEEHHQDYLQKHPGGYTCHYPRSVSFY
jgi:methionine-S-sulfoxide reductase